MQIGSISEGAAPDPLLKTNLHDKICVITLDGNAFGKAQDRALENEDTIEGQKAFDDNLDLLRARLIARVYSKLIKLRGTGAPCAAEQAVRQELSDVTQGDIIRFELLLWGGDEIMFIVPARLGWELLEEIGAAVDAATLNTEKVTFAVGAVICHHDAPIARIKALADDLARHVKKLKKVGGDGRDGKAQTLFMIEVPESFDHIGGEVAAHLAGRLPKPTGAALPPAAGAAFHALDLGELALLREVAQALAAGTGGKLSRGRLRQTAHALHHGAAPGADYRGANWCKSVAETAVLLQGEAGTAAKAKTEAQPQGLARDRFLVLLLMRIWLRSTPAWRKSWRAESQGSGGAEPMPRRR